MLNVERADDADALLFERERVLPALGVRRVAEVVVSEFVENDDVGLFAHRRFVIEVLKDDVADPNLARRNARQPRGGALEIGAAFCLDPTDGDALAVRTEAPRVFEEAARFTRARCACDVNDKARTPAKLA